MEEKDLQTTEKAVKAKKKMEPKKKKITIAAVIVGIIAVVAILIGINHTAIMSDINYAFMPKSITPTVDGVQVEFFVYKNKDFNQFKDKNTPLKPSCIPIILSSFNFNFLNILFHLFY